MKKAVFFFAMAIATLSMAKAQGFIHPGGLHTDKDFARIRAQIDPKSPDYDASVLAAYNKLKSNNHAQSTYTPRPQARVSRGDAVNGDNYSIAMNDAAAAYQLGLMWHISGENRYADAAVGILNGWAKTCKEITGDTNASLAGGIYGYEFAQAGELLRNYEGWNRSDFRKYQEWMRYLWYMRNKYFLEYRHGRTCENGDPGSYFSNWGLCNALSMMTIGILCDDVFIFNEGLSYYTEDKCGTFSDNRNPVRDLGCTEFLGNLVTYMHPDPRGPLGYLGQMQESGRDQGHALMAVGLAADVCQTAWNQGYDLFSYMDNRLAAGFEYLGLVNSLDTDEQVADSVPFTTHIRTGFFENWTATQNGLGARGGSRPIWHRIVGHYEGVKGIPMQYSKKMAAKLGVDGGGGDYGPNSGGYDHLGFSKLTSTLPAIDPEKAPLSLNAKIAVDNFTEQKNYVSEVTPGALVKLIPELPEGTAGDGTWLWETGETTKELEFAATSSGVYRVTYTSAAGIASRLTFFVQVYGDCFPEIIVPSVTTGGTTYEDSVVTVLYGSSITLKIARSMSWSESRFAKSIQWNNGTTNSLECTIDNIRSSRTYWVKYTTPGGYVKRINFQINVSLIDPALKVGSEAVQKTNTAFINAGQQVELRPTVATGRGSGTWLWSDGSTASTLLLENVQKTVSPSVVYTYDGVEYPLGYTIYVKTNNKPMEEGDYFIKDASSGQYYTNNGTLQPAFTERSEENPLSQSWKISKDTQSGRYKIVSNLDGRFMEEHGRFNDHDYFPEWNTYLFHGLANADWYVIQNGGSAGTKLWGIAGGIITETSSTTVEGYPFEIIPYSLTGITETADRQELVSFYTANGDLVIDIKEVLLPEASLVIYSISGTPLQTLRCTAGKNTVHTGDLSKGLYICALTVNGKLHTFKFTRH